MTDNIYDGVRLEQALASGELEKHDLVLTGMVKSSETPHQIGFSLVGCETWVNLPTSMIEKAERRGERRCKDHSHPVFALTLKESDHGEVRTLAALLMQSAQVRSANMPIQMQGEHGGRGPRINARPSPITRREPPYVAMGSQPHGRVVRRADAHGNANSGFKGRANQSLQMIGGGGLTGLGGDGGLNEWGCWDACCEFCCLAGHYEENYGGGFRQWVCDWEECCDPCTLCIWPW
jgi:hypothetical protein